LEWGLGVWCGIILSLAVNHPYEEKTRLIRTLIRICEEFGSQFQELVFPHPFISDNKKFDLGLLLNVPPVMPVFSERLYVLKLLYDKIEDGKYLLWVAQREGAYKKIREEGNHNIGDGIWRGINRKYKTFYKYHRIRDLDEMMSLYGFKLIKRWSIGDDARLYEKTNHNLFEDIITPEKIRQYIPIDESIADPEKAILNAVENTPESRPVIPNPMELTLESLYIEKINSIPKGHDNAELYHRVISHAIARIFRDSLKNMEIKIDTNSGLKIIDTIFSNYAKDGFFLNLKSHCECNWPIFEMKNISEDPANREFDQLNGRFKTGRGNFGVLICREVEDEETVIDRCKSYFPDSFIICLTDEDVIELMNLSRYNNLSEIYDIMDSKIRQIVF